MNIAIVIGVSKYSGAHIGDLPACAADGHLMDGILKSSGRFEQVLSLTTNTDSKAIKRELAKFIGQQKDKAIDEVFFYYTGHGDAQGGDVQFLLTDFDDTRVKQTSLSNAEVDTLLRSLKPKLAVKVVDACHAGVAYVKDRSVLQKAVAATEGQFEHCYFMFSCRKDQVSFQDPAHLSEFTASFARAVKAYAGSSIRYQDIADFIADEFTGNGEQTPLFVTQASLTDVFVDVNEPMVGTIDAALAKPDRSTDGPTTTASEPPAPNLAQLVENDAQQYCSQPEAIESLNTLAAAVKQYQFSTDIEALFAVTVDDALGMDSIPERAAIGRWLKDNPNDYFAAIESHWVEAPLPEYVVQFSVFGKRNKHMEEVVDGFSITVEGEVASMIGVDLVPRYQNLHRWGLRLTYVFSKTVLRVFYAYQRFRDVAWDKQAQSAPLSWKTDTIPLKDREQVREWVAKVLLAGFEQDVLADLNARFRPQSPAVNKVGSDS
jgi:hypothetical protein